MTKQKSFLLKVTLIAKFKILVFYKKLSIFKSFNCFLKLDIAFVDRFFLSKHVYFY